MTSGSRFSMQSDDEAAFAALIAVFAKVDALPCPATKSSVVHGYGKRGSCEHRFDMGSHIIGAFAGMLPGPCFRCQSVEGHGHVCAYIRVGIFADSQ